MSTPEPDRVPVAGSPDPVTVPADISTGPLPTAGPVVGATQIPSSDCPGADSRGAARYEVLRFHAKGGMGQVSVALDSELHREVAFKEIQPHYAENEDAVRRFVLEAEVTGRLEHPGIVPIYGLGIHPDGRPFYAMRFIQGESLREAIQRFHAADRTKRDPGERELALRGLLRRFVDVCNAVAFAHDRRWLHRDIKPSNVMLGKYGETLLVDWGLARAVDHGPEGEQSPELCADQPFAEHNTQQGQALGTPAYMSPEQARGDWTQVGPRSDVYSLGATLYELLSGRAPFEGPLLEVLAAVREGRFQPARQRNPRVPRALDAVVSRAMTLRNEDRYGTALELAQEVERWLADEPVRAYREPVAQRARRWGRRHRVLVSSLAVLLLTLSVALSVGLVLVNQARERADEAELATREALRQSKEAERSASTQRKLALETITRVIHEINGRVKGSPDLQDLQETLLDQSLEGLKQVARAADIDTAINHQQIWVHLELGDLFWQIGNRGVQSAKEQYDRACALARQSLEADSKNSELERALYVSLQRLGDVQIRLGDAKAAVDTFHEFQKRANRLAEGDPKNPAYQHDLSVALTKLGDLRLQQGDAKGALESYQQCHDIAKLLADAEPALSRYHYARALSLRNLGKVQLLLGETKEALKSSQLALLIARTLAASAPKVAEFQRTISGTLLDLGEARLRLGETKAALECFQSAHEICKGLAEADPRKTVAQHDFYATLTRRGDVHIKLGDTKTALDCYLQAQAIIEKLFESDSKNIEHERDYATTLNTLGDLQKRLGETNAALKSYQRCFDIRRRLAESDSTNATFQLSLSTALVDLGDVQTVRGETKLALESYQHCHKIRKRLAESDPKNASLQRDLAASLARLGDVRRVLGESQVALEFYQHCHDILKRQAKADPMRTTL